MIVGPGPPWSGELTLYLGEKFSIEFKFDIAGGMGHVRYLLPPRIKGGLLDVLAGDLVIPVPHVPSVEEKYYP